MFFHNKEAVMARKTALVKMTGDLADLRPDVIEWIRALSQKYFVVICTGGGTRISELFNERGIPFTFGPLGREIGSFEGRQLARDVLEINQAEIQDRLAVEGITATVIVPVLDVGSVLCHVNGDTFVLTAYLGYDAIYVLTLESRKERKKNDFEKYPKVEVVGFPDEPKKRKWAALSETLKKVGIYNNARLDPRLLSSQFHSGRAIIRETPELVGHRTIQAFAALWGTADPLWWEIGTIWVDPRLRGNGLLSELVTDSTSLAPKGGNLFLITSERAVMISGVNHGFRPVTKALMPDIEAWAATVGLGYRLPRTALQEIPPFPVAGERWLFVRGA